MSQQEKNEGTSNGRNGYKGTSLLLMFAGGALTGAAVAYLAQAQNRERVRAIAKRARERAGQFPRAMREASHAARTAFAEAQSGHGEVVASRQK